MLLELEERTAQTASDVHRKDSSTVVPVCVSRSQLKNCQHPLTAMQLNEQQQELDTVG